MLDLFSLKTLEKIGRWLWELFYNVIIIFLLVSLVRNFLISPFEVKGNSMESTLHNEDFIVVNKLTYHFTSPKFGQIIIFTPPHPRQSQLTGFRCAYARIARFYKGKDACAYPEFFIKRIIGVPGDQIKIENGEVYRNGELLKEDYLNVRNQHKTFLFQGESAEYQVPEGYYFVLGDNRLGSSDSRARNYEWQDPKTGKYQPFIKESSIDSQYLFTLFSIQKIKNIFSQ
ncbi:MAG TPA: signal peptidase I [Candidatus Gracilibacteria bacterium]|nr:signal peptidase I [Candidatus Gracilibacteria bacterium]